MNKRQWWLLAAIIFAGAAVRLLGIGSESFYFDELYNVWANKLSLGGMLREQLAAGHPPLYYLVARGWYSFGTSEVWTRSLSTLADIFTIIFVFLAARELFSRRAGLWAAAFAAASPLLIWYARANTYYSFLIAVSALSFWLLARASLRGGWGNWAAYVVGASALLFSYFYGVVLIAAGWVFYLLIGRRERKFLIQWLASQAAILVVTGITYLVSKSSTAEPHRLNIPGPGQLKKLVYDLTVAPFVLLAGKVDNGINYSGEEGLPVSHVALFILMVLVGVVVYLTSRWFRGLLRDRKLTAVAGFVFLMVAGPLVLQLVNGGALTGRFYVWAAPAFMLLAAAVVAAAPAKVRAVLGGVFLAGLLAISIWEINNSHSGDADWRALMGTIAEQQADGDRVAGFPLHNVSIAADYYLARPLPIAGGMPAMGSDAIFFLPPGEKWGGYRSGYFVGSGATPPLAGAELDERLNADLSGATRIWLVALNDLLPPGVKSAIDSNWEEKGRWDYSPFELILYEPRAG